MGRFTTCVLQSGVEIPYLAIKTNIADFLNLIVQIERRPRRRFVVEVLEIDHFDVGTDKFKRNPTYVRNETGTGFCP